MAMAGIEGRPCLTGVFCDILSERASLITGHMACFGCPSVHWPSAAKLVQDSVNGARKVARNALLGNGVLKRPTGRAKFASSWGPWYVL